MHEVLEPVMVVVTFALWGGVVLLTAFSWWMGFHDDSWRPDLFALYLALVGAAIAIALGIAIVLYILRLLGLL